MAMKSSYTTPWDTISISRSVVGKKDFQRIDPLFGDDMIVDQRVQLLQFKLVRQITLIEEAVAR